MPLGTVHRTGSRSWAGIGADMVDHMDCIDQMDRVHGVAAVRGGRQVCPYQGDGGVDSGAVSPPGASSCAVLRASS